MAKTRASGADAQLLAAFEANYGVIPDGSGGGIYHKMLFASSGLSEARPLGEDPLLGLGRATLDPFYDASSTDGDIVVPIDLRAFGMWLKAALGAPATVDNGDGTYNHTFTAGGDVPSLTLEIGHTKLATPRYNKFAGVKINTIAFDMARTGAARATVSVVAQGEEPKTQTPADATPEEFALVRFNQGKGSINVGGNRLGNVTAGNLSFSNNLDLVETLREDGKIDGADETTASVSGSINVRFSTDTTLEDAINSEAPLSLEYRYLIPDTSYAIIFTIPRVFLPKPKREISGPGGISASFDWQASGADTAIMTVTLINDVAAY
jgi:hypothetical protein